MLEVACGTGRVTIPIARAVGDVVGLDLSEPMLVRAGQKAKAERVAIEWVRGDCRDFHLGRAFNLVLIPYNSMLHLHDRGSLEAFLTCAREHLRPSGRFRILRKLGGHDRRPFGPGEPLQIAICERAD